MQSTVESEPLAIFSDRVLTGLVDVTSDLAALDEQGIWAVVLPFEGQAVCARFATEHRTRRRSTAAWSGVGPVERWASSLEVDDFLRGVHSIRGRIGAGDVYQVNLTRRLSVPVPATADVVGLGAMLARGNPAPFSAVVRAGGYEIACASPERFLSVDGRAVRSSPIKGTAVSATAFLEKDYAENVMICDLVRNDLGRVCEWGTVRVDALCSVERHPGLAHLVSTVSGKLRTDVGWVELIDATFPPGSVTGAPKLAALSVIAELEPVPRGPYCGAIGWVDADRGRAELAVAIRTF